MSPMSHNNDDAEYEDALLSMVEGRFFGKYRATIAKNEDPKNRGRLLVEVPTVLPDQQVWALPCVPYAGPKIGTYFIPPVGARVWVEFEGGDTSHPIWVGCYWGEDEAPDTDPAVKVIQTDKFTIRIDDDAGTLTIENQLGTRLELDNATISAEANAQITHQVKLMKTSLDVTKFEVNDGALEVV